MMFRALTIALVAALSCAGARAETCAPEAKVRSDITHWPWQSTVVAIEGRELETFLAQLNHEPPPTNFTADKALIVEADSKPNALVVLFTGDCAKLTFGLPRGYLHRLLGSI